MSTFGFNGIDLTAVKMEAIDGEKHIEREYTAYAEVESWDWLEMAPQKEVHEQWFIGLKDADIKQRIRLINNRRYTQTVKQPLKGEEGAYECEIDISPDMFAMLKLAGTLGFLKERYTFPIEGTGLCWEIDVFKSKSGGRHPWVKIDLEYVKRGDPVPEFPFPVKTLLIDDRGGTIESKEMISQLWDKEWLQLEKNSASGSLI